MQTTTTAKLIAAASLALGGLTLAGCHSDSDQYDRNQQGTYRSADDNYRPAEHRMDSYNTGSGGTGTGSPMGDSIGRYPSGSPSSSFTVARMSFSVSASHSARTRCVGISHVSRTSGSVSVSSPRPNRAG